MTTTVAVLTGVVASLVASLFWLAATRRVRPKIEISPVVAEFPQTSDPDRKARYQIKIINGSRRVATDLIFELVLLRPSREKGGEVKVRRPVEVLGPPPLLLAGYHRGDKDAHNAYRVSISHDLRQVVDALSKLVPSLAHRRPRQCHRSRQGLRADVVRSGLGTTSRPLRQGSDVRNSG